MSQNSSLPAAKTFLELLETVHRLRAPGGCPWDREQTHQSLRRHLIEEAYEVLEVIDQIQTSDDLTKPELRSQFAEELGDLLLQILLHSEMAQEVQAFDIQTVMVQLNEKLIRRHPHVFGEEKVSSAEKALETWEKQKLQEKEVRKKGGVLDSLPKQLPALQRATRMIEKMSQVGFQWKDLRGPIEKVEEEWREFKNELNQSDPTQHKATQLQRIENELGDLLFSICNVSYFLKFQPEEVLRNALNRIQKRFAYIERRFSQQGLVLQAAHQDQMEIHWSESKVLEKAKIWGLTGGIGAGKSTVAKYFEQNGIPVIDADQIVKRLSEKGGAAYPLIEAHFGTTERSRLREIIYNDPAKKVELEKILHPLVAAESYRQMLSLADKHPLIIYEATLLIETGRHHDFDALVVVEASQQSRLERLLTRDKLSEDMARKIIASQLPDEERRKHAQYVILNNGSENDLASQVQDLLKTYSTLQK